jgi:hypothetical protein
MVYLAKVDNAASASQNGLKWYVVPEIRGLRGSSLTSWAGSRFGKMRSIPAAGNGVLTT